MHDETKQIDDGEPAFPVEVQYRNKGEPLMGRQTSDSTGYVTGMSLRDYFAAKAMQGSMANPDRADATGITDESHASIAKYAYRVADAMLAARKE